jgi:hypothetical protein
MLQVHARFYLMEDTRVTHYTYTGKGSSEKVEAARVKLGAVQGEPFGSASPSGTLDMVIVNPEALKVFRDAELGQEFDLIISPVQSE